MFRNIFTTSSYVFKSTVSGVAVFDHSENELGVITVVSGANAVWANDDYVYIGTSISGVMTHTITAISGGIFTDLNSFLCTPNITGNYINYLHGNCDYLCVTTNSGVDQINLDNSNRIYTTINDPKVRATKCFQTATGRFYYVTDHSFIENSFSGLRNKFTLNKSTNYPDYSLQMVFDPYSIIGTELDLLGRDIRFYDLNGDRLSHFKKEWSYYGQSELYVKLPDMGTSAFYFVYGHGKLDDLSEPGDVFLLYDDFSGPTISGMNWPTLSSGIVYSFGLEDSAYGLEVDNSGSTQPYHYIETDTIFNSPLRIEQRIQRTSGTSVGDSCVYGCTLEPNKTGIELCYDDDYGIFLHYNGTEEVVGDYTVHMNRSDYITLSVCFIDNYIKLIYDYDPIELPVNKSWNRTTNELTNRSLRIFSTNPDFKVICDYVLACVYDENAPEFCDVETSDPYYIYTSKLNTMYNNVLNWVTPDFVYEPDNSVLREESVINDIFVTEGTSKYSGSDNVIFLATNFGAVIIEERQNDESNSRVKYYVRDATNVALG